jgi:hypothetical protein
MTDIPIPESVIRNASTIKPGRGAQKMQALADYAAEFVPDSEQIIDWRRNSDGILIAVTAPIPEDE